MNFARASVFLLLPCLPFAPAAAGDLRVQGQLISEAPQGTAPLQVDSTTGVPNLNADLLDGMTADDFAGVSELATAGSGVGVHWKNLINLPVVEIDQDCATGAGCDTGNDSSGFPVTITDPGNYRLASDLTTNDQNTHLISIEDANITLDLNGFALNGPVTCSGTPVTGCSPTGGTGNGVHVVSSAGPNVIIMNGNITGMGRSGIDCAAPCRIRDIRASENDFAGVRTSVDAVVEDVMARRNGFAGIVMNGLLANCQATGNAIRGIQSDGSLAVTRCTASNNGSGGIKLSGSVAHSRSDNNVGNGFVLGSGTTAIGNTARDNSISGFSSGVVSGMTVRNNVAHSNNAHGFDLDKALLVNNSASENGDDGFVCGDCIMLDNLSVENTDHGIVFLGTTSVWGGNTLIGNGNDTTGTVADRGNNFCDGVAC